MSMNVHDRKCKGAGMIPCSPIPARSLTARLIADALNIPVAAIEAEHLWAYGMGWLDEGSSCALWLRDYKHPALRHIPEQERTAATEVNA